MLVSCSAHALVGGQEAKPGQFPGIVLIEDCTASKIGARHFLLAAHCVVDSSRNQTEDESLNNQTKTEFGEGSQVRLDQNVTHKKWTHELTIVRSHVHPAYRYSWSEYDLRKPQVLPDIAVIEVKEATKDIPLLPLEFSPLKAGDGVVKVGYGCPYQNEAEIKDWLTDGERVLRYSPAATASPETLTTYASTAKLSFYADLRDFISASYALTLGRFPTSPDKEDKTKASLGFTDSGGPLLAGKKLVGINSKSLLWPKVLHKSKLEPVAIDLHTRLSHVQDWIEDTLKAKAPSLLLVEFLEGKKTKWDLPLRKYLQRETKKLTLRLLKADGSACGPRVKKVSVWDANNEEDIVWAEKPDEDELELLLKTSKGDWIAAAEDEILPESLSVEIEGKIPGRCLLQVSGT